MPLNDQVTKLVLGQLIGMGIPMAQAIKEANGLVAKLAELYAGKDLESLLEPPVRYAAQLDLDKMESDVLKVLKGPGS